MTRATICLLLAALACGDGSASRLGEPREDRAGADTGSAAAAEAGPPGERPDSGASGPAGARAIPDRAEWTAGIVDAPAAGATGARPVLTGLRWGAHGDYDRVTFEFGEAAVPAHHIEYVDTPVRRCGSGQPTPIEGDGWLEVRLRGTAAHTDDGESTLTEREVRPDLGNLREIEVTCDFEGEVVVVLGVASPNRYRVLVLDEPARLAVDIRR